MKWNTNLDNLSNNWNAKANENYYVTWGSVMWAFEWRSGYKSKGFKSNNNRLLAISLRLSHSQLTRAVKSVEYNHITLRYATTKLPRLPFFFLFSSFFFFRFLPWFCYSDFLLLLLLFLGWLLINCLLFLPRKLIKIWLY
jgi:hypothetical protein